MDEPIHSCMMCSFITRSLDTLTSHIIKMHKNDAQFNVSCKSCLRSYTRWDSFRKHIQRGCSEPISVSSSTFTSLGGDEEETVIEHENDDLSSSRNSSLVKSWHEAAFILTIKEKCVVSQVVIDQIIVATKIYVSDLLQEIIRNLHESLTDDTIEQVKIKMKQASDHLFHDLSSAFLQHSYFLNNFNLVVSFVIARYIADYTYVCTYLGTYEHFTWFHFDVA